MTKEQSNKRVLPKDPIFTKEYWDRPPLLPTDQGDADATGIYLNVGRALSEWEVAENAIADLFLQITNAHDSRSYVAVARAFGSIESSDGRRKALEAAAEVYFGQHWSDDAVRYPFSDLMSGYGFAAGRRADIAHGYTTHLAAEGKDKGVFLVPAGYNTRRNRSPFPVATSTAEDPLAFMRGKYRYTAAQIGVFGAKFKEIRNATFAYLMTTQLVGGRPIWMLKLEGLSDDEIHRMRQQ